MELEKGHSRQDTQEESGSNQQVTTFYKTTNGKSSGLVEQKNLKESKESFLYLERFVKFCTFWS